MYCTHSSSFLPARQRRRRRPLCWVFAILWWCASAAEQASANQDNNDNPHEEGICTTSTNNNDNDNDDNDTVFCQIHSQTALALEMVQYSSPPGSLSYQKLHHLLNTFDHFFVNIQVGHGIFEDVADNMATMMQGYGLSRVDSHAHPNTIAFMTIFFNHYGMEKLKSLALDGGASTNTKEGVILLQTEQVCCIDYHSKPEHGAVVLTGLSLCHQAKQCVILEYSSQNYEWFVQQGWGDSVVLMPTLNQGRLDSYLEQSTAPIKNNNVDHVDATTGTCPHGNSSHQLLVKPMAERSLDVVFFGYMTQRRTAIVQTLQHMNANPSLVLGNTPNQQQPQPQLWNMMLEDNPDRPTMASAYANAKICLVVHSFGTRVPGEIHRLSEMAPFGCRPVMEAFGDTVATRVYQRCGGVVFFDTPALHELPQTLGRQLQDLIENNSDNDNDEMLQRRVAWWRNRIEWKTLLQQIFGERSKS